MIRIRRTAVALGAACTIALGAAVAVPATGPGAPVAAATGLGDLPDAPERANGSGVVSSEEPIELVAGNDAWRADATRYKYTSTDSRGRASVDSALYIEPRTPWHGDGPRPLILVAPGTQGVGPHCDPTLSSEVGLAIPSVNPPDLVTGYELIPVAAHLNNGAAVVIIDHHRNEDTGHQEYVDNISSGQSLLDAGVAARELGADPEAPVGIHGYSQGGGTAGWAAEHHERYAEELNVVASAVGAPPSDLNSVLDAVDGGILVGVLAYAFNMVLDKDPELRREIYEEVLNDKGREFVDANANLCVAGTALHSGLTDTRDLIEDGRSLKEVLGDYPQVQAELERQRLGKSKPTSPVFLYGGTNDDVIPVGQVRELRDEWAGKGADVTYVEDATPALQGKLGVNHLAPMLVQMPPAIDFIWSRITGTGNAGLPGSSESAGSGSAGSAAE